ncbi:Serine protease, subtilisin family [Halopseudomonas xinjiangensis]|uniref:Serine protease, subtilisin family n=1 Tax=Halopseudomonas xinjiangensis TaxID=487184 RepID=A0A1H1MVT8_9GAMM|nr:S8 family peptidase [Halopseudomonas xinjiangensis]SDR90790.1 Serine protease, subtilisin family [Halopseudomonas xinjiangensis]
MPKLSFHTRPVCLAALLASSPLVLLPIVAHAQNGSTPVSAAYTNVLSQDQIQALVNAANQSDAVLRQRAGELMSQGDAIARSVYVETQGLVSAEQSAMLEGMLEQSLANNETRSSGMRSDRRTLGWVAGGALIVGIGAAAAGGGGGGGGGGGEPAPAPAPEEPAPGDDEAPPVEEEPIGDSLPTLTPPTEPVPNEPVSGDPGTAPDPGPLPGEDDSAKALPLSREHQNTNGYNLTYGHVAHERGFSGLGERIAIIDSGVNSSHLELQGQIAAHYNLLTGSTAEADAQDSGGHGTHVAGTLVARRNAFGVVGYAYGAQLLNVRFSDANDNISANDQQLANGFAWARNNGATWFNNSWGIDATVADFGKGAVESYFPKLRAEWQAGAAAGRIYVWATGNEGLSQPLVFSAIPQLYPELQYNWVAVTSVDSDTGVLSSFSNACGDAAAWCIAAPGTDIVSSYVEGDSSYAIASGTSMAAPAVTGGLAVIRQAFPTLEPEQVVQRLFVTAYKEGIYANQSLYGQGLMDLEKATRPVGTLTVVSDSGETLSVDNTALVLGGAFGYDNPLASLQVMATDSLDAGFSVDLGSQVSERRYRYDTHAAWQRLGRSWHEQNDGDTALYWTASTGSMPSSQVRRFDQGEGRSLSIGQVDDLDMLSAGRSWAGYSQLDSSLSSPLWLQQPGERTMAVRQRLPLGSFSLDMTSTANSLRQGMAVGLNLPTAGGYASTLELGYVRSDDGLFDSHGRGAFDLDDVSETLFAGVHGELLQGALTFGHSAYIGQSRTDADGLFRDLGTVTTSSWMFAGRYALNTATLGLVVQQPLRVESAETSINVATGYAGNLFDMQALTLDLSPDGRQVNLEAFWQKPVWKDSDVKLSWLGIREPGHQAQAGPMQVFMAQWQQRF